ncbi:MAG: ROK family protein [Thermoleophilaceae bacterium]|nr:ROK family protein [Thermoleophilaceae bacterium]
MAGQVIGVDVGASKVAVATLRAGALGRPTVEPTSTAGPEALMDEIAGAVAAVRTGDTEAVGVGIPAVLEFSTGRVKWSANARLEDVELRVLLEERLGVPVFVDNDANCAALAEAHDDAEPDVRDLVMLTVGTGIGGGLVLGGRVYRGHTGAAGELGHTLVGALLEHGAPAAGRFPQAGSLEALAAGRALDALAEAAARAEPGSALAARLAESGRVTGRDAVDAALAGDAAARRLVALVGERLGVGIANAINTFDPEVVAVGGGVSAAGELLLGPARDSARRFVVPGVGERTVIRVSRYGADAGVRGAALLARQEL